MSIQRIFKPSKISELAKKRFEEERGIDHLEGWFRVLEIQKECNDRWKDEPESIRIAKTQLEVIRNIPLWVSDFSVFTGTQDDAFARSYALINPAFQVESFSGYCDPVAVFDYIEPRDDITQERIDNLRNYENHTEFADALRYAYDLAKGDTEEALFFVEQVTGHLIPDVRTLLAKGVLAIRAEISGRANQAEDEDKKAYYKAMDFALEGVLLLAERYKKMVQEKKRQATGKDREKYGLMEATLQKVPAKGADTLYEAVQSFILIWQSMCLEQAPNPFAFSVGNADRIFEPYRQKEGLDREMTAAILKHLLVFFNVADRSWAISQNLIVGGKSNVGEDLTNLTTYALMDAYYDMNLPQPILSVKLHKNTPDELYESLGRFWFTPGCLTPSLFNDEAVFEVLKNRSGIAENDLEDYSVAGCQEPLIMGKDNGNTTNSWLNLAKILELIVNDGKSLLTNRKYGNSYSENGYADGVDVLKNIREIFYKNVDEVTDKMATCANAASEAISLKQIPFLSVMMGGIETGIDARDTKRQGTKYNGSGCLIHGLTNVADSFLAIDTLLKEHPEYADRMVEALRTDFEKDLEIRQYLLSCPKFGNNIASVDEEARVIADKVSDIVSSKKNYLGNPFRCDFSTPSTHLLYGYWVGATPDGRKATEQLGYGVDPLYGDAHQGLGFRVLSTMKLPFDKMNGGYASHFGINPGYFKSAAYEEKGMEFKEKIIAPLFFNEQQKGISPFYLYVNVTTPDMLRKVLENPKKYAPSGVYIMRIHGTFVNFLDLSPAIQEDIMKRLDLESTSTTLLE